MYPVYQQDVDKSELQDVVCLLRRALIPDDSAKPDAFTGWQRLAAKSLFWTYDGEIGSACPVSYVEAAQLKTGSFGELQSSDAQRRALDFVRIFIPEQSEINFKILSRSLPLPLWSSLSEEDRSRLLKNIKTKEEVIPWAQELLKRARGQADDIVVSCDQLQGDIIAAPFKDKSFWDSNRNEIRSRFNRILDSVSELCGFLAEALDEAFSKSKLRARIEKQLIPEFAKLIELISECLQKSEPSLSCTLKFADSLNELIIEKLSAHLDVEREELDNTISIYSNVLLPAFRHAVANGDLESALSLRMLFPQETGGNLRRDSVDDFISESQAEICGGLKIAAHLLAKKTLGAEREKDVDIFRRALATLVDPKSLRKPDIALFQAVGLVAYKLLERGNLHGEVFWGCQQVGHVLLPLKREPRFISNIGEAIYKKNKALFTSTVAAFIASYNQDTELQRNIPANVVLAVHQMCEQFSDQVPAPVTKHVSREKLMRDYFADAKQRWRGVDIETVPVSSMIRREVTMITPEIDLYVDTPAHVDKYAHNDGLSAHAAKVVATFARSGIKIGEKIDSRDYKAVVAAKKTEVKAQLSNDDSSDFSITTFQENFAELLAAFCWGESGLAENERLEIAILLGRMLTCKNAGVICGVEAVRRTLALTLSGPHKPGSLAGLLKSHNLKDLIQSWEYDS
jgi:hypothetical protein